MIQVLTLLEPDYLKFHVKLLWATQSSPVWCLETPSTVYKLLVNDVTISQGRNVTKIPSFQTTYLTDSSHKLRKEAEAWEYAFEDIVVKFNKHSQYITLYYQIEVCYEYPFNSLFSRTHWKMN